MYYYQGQIQKIKKAKNTPVTLPYSRRDQTYDVKSLNSNLVDLLTLCFYFHESRFDYLKILFSVSATKVH